MATYLKKEFRRRLIHLRNAIDLALVIDNVSLGLLPALYSVFTYLWCKNPNDLVRHGK